MSRFEHVARVSSDFHFEYLHCQSSSTQTLTSDPSAAGNKELLGAHLNVFSTELQKWESGAQYGVAVLGQNRLQQPPRLIGDSVCAGSSKYIQSDLRSKPAPLPVADIHSPLKIAHQTPKRLSKLWRDLVPLPSSSMLETERNPAGTHDY